MATTTKAAPKAKKAPAKKAVAKKPVSRARKPPIVQHEVDLSYLIPDMSWFDDYVSREIGGLLDTAILEYAHNNMQNVLLFGPTGPGKTSCVMAYAALKQLPIVTLACNGAVDPAVTWGGPRMAADRTLFYQESETVAVIRQGGILYMDEVNFLPGRIGAVFHPLLDKRRQVTLQEKGNERIKAADDLFIVGAYNPDYADTRPMNAAFKNRFNVKLHFDYDRKVEAELVSNVPLLDLADMLRDRHATGDLETPVSTNMLITFEEILLDLGFTFAVENFLANFEMTEMSSVREVFELNRQRIEEQAAELVAEVKATFSQ